MSERIDQLNEVLSKIEIGDPVKSLLSPAMLFVEDHPDGNVRLRLRINSFDANTGNHLMGFEASFSITHYLVGRYTRKPLDLAAFVQRSIVSFFEHELQESIWFDGELAFPPAHWGPSETEMNEIRESMV